MDLNKVFYVWDEQLIKQCDRIPAVPGRASLVHDLLVAYGLHQNIKVVRSVPASYSDLREFHSELYLDHLKKITDIDDDYLPDNEVEYGIGNGVQDAYSSSKFVFTLSFHKYEPGFYPGTGSIDDIGTLAGKGYACNVPLHAKYNDDTLVYIFDNVFTSVYTHFEPDVIVVQCGADALAYDPYGKANVTTEGYCKCIKMILDKQKPTLLLGGGGYKHDNVARLWTSITALVSGTILEDDIPEHSHWPKYGPSYTLSIEPTLAKDLNKFEYLEDCIAKIKANLKMYLEESTVIKQEKLGLKCKNIALRKGEEAKRRRISEKEEMVSTAESKLSKETSQIEVTMKTETSDVYDFSDE